MADYIDRADAVATINELLKSPYAQPRDAFGCGVADALRLVRDIFEDKVPGTLRIPTANVVTVVRCKDCICKRGKDDA